MSIGSVNGLAPNKPHTDVHQSRRSCRWQDHTEPHRCYLLLLLSGNNASGSWQNHQLDKNAAGQHIAKIYYQYTMNARTQGRVGCTMPQQHHLYKAIWGGIRWRWRWVFLSKYHLASNSPPSHYFSCQYVFSCRRYVTLRRPTAVTPTPCPTECDLVQGGVVFRMPTSILVRWPICHGTNGSVHVIVSRRLLPSTCFSCMSLRGCSGPVLVVCDITAER